VFVSDELPFVKVEHENYAASDLSRTLFFMLTALFYGLMALGSIGMAFQNPISDLSFWLFIEFSVLLALIAWVNASAGQDYEQQESESRNKEGIRTGETRG